MKNKRTRKTFMLVMAMIMCFASVFAIVPVVYAAGDAMTLNGWTLDEGYSVTGIWVYEGSYALEHTGAASNAVSQEILLEDGVTYYVSAYVRPETADSKVEISFAGQTMVSAGSGKWEELSVIVLGTGAKEQITVTATGKTQIDGITVRPFKEGSDMVNGTFDSGNAPIGIGEWLDEFQGYKGVLKFTGGGVQVGATGVSVETNSYYLYSADFYLEENPPWAYIDMNDATQFSDKSIPEIQLRGTKIGEWHTVSGVWYSGKNSSTPIRLVKEDNWDNPNAAAPISGAAYVDNISFKKVTLYDDLITDEGFEKGGGADWVTVNNDSKDIIYGEGSQYGTPAPGSNPPPYINGDYTNVVGYAQFTFTGTQVKWASGKSLDCDIANVYLDDMETPVATVDLGADHWYTEVVYDSGVLPAGEHTIKIVPTATGQDGNFGHKRQYTGMDAFIYMPVEDTTEAVEWQLNEGASQQSGTHYLYGSKSLKLVDNASAVANNGAVIKVAPNSYYYYSAWRLRPGNDRNVDASIKIKTADGSAELASITGSRYNQTLWNPADANPNNAAESRTGQWEQIFGFWFSGDNTEIKLWAESEGTGVVYFDDVTFNQFENRAAQKNIFTDGDMEGYIPDAVELKPSGNEKERVKADYESFMADGLKNFPVSFKVGSSSYRGFGKDFTLASQTDEAVFGGTKTISVLRHASGLEFTVESVFYPEYNAYDWTVYITNKGDTNSPIISGLNAVDLTFDGEAPKLKGSVGDDSAYEPYNEDVAGRSVTKHPNGGRGTEQDSSYFNFMYGDKGVLYAVGWPGQWTMTVDNSNEDAPNKTRMTAGQQTLNTYLAPGETIRTPLMAFVHYNGRNLERATNLWRAWMIDCNMNKITKDMTGEGEEKLPDAAIFAATSIQWHEMTRATDENQIAAIDYYLDHNVDLTYWWMDAGWYYKLDAAGNFVTVDDWGWTATGAWVVDDSRFPSKMKDISDYAAASGIKTLLWFEPERIANADALRTDGKTVHPSWVLDGYLLDMGNPAAVDWTFDRIKTVMEEGGISMYREDFNCHPLSAWTNADAKKSSEGDRKGITENLHIQGHLELWDRILDYFPNATIDSCASGGRRNDLETMRRAVPLHKTDHAYGDQTWQQAVTTDMTRWIPYIGTKANGEVEANDNTTTANRYALRTALAPAMVLGYNTDSKNAPVDWDIIEDITEEHKVIGKFIYSDYYVLENWSRNEADWAAWEYYDVDMGEGYAIAYRRSDGAKANTYRLKGLEKDTEYKIWFEDANTPVIRTGLDLMQNGVEFKLPCIESSDILHIQKAANADADRALLASITEVSINGQYKGAVNSTVKEGYDRFDIRFNMALRDTLLSKAEGKLEKDVTDDYKDTISIDGKKVSALLAEDATAVIMDYDVLNNILNVYVKNGIMDTADTAKVTVSSALSADGGAAMDGASRFTYTAADDKWTKSGAVYAESVTVLGNTEMKVGGTQKLSATVLPEETENKAVKWTSSDKDIATVDADGNVKAVAEGTVTITASAVGANGEITDKIDITVTDSSGGGVYAESVEIFGNTSMTQGQTQELKATVLPINTENKTVTWKSSNDSIAVVDENGKVTAVAPGEVTIFASAEGANGAVTDSITITVTAKTVVVPGGGNGEDPKMGDDTKIVLWVILAVLALMGAITGAVFVSKRIRAK